MSRSLYDTAVGALLGGLVGDALGLPWHERSAAEIPKRLDMLAGKAGRATYSDDTEMTVAVAESLLDCGTIVDDELAHALVRHRTAGRGYGAGTSGVLRLIARGVAPPAAARLAFGGAGSFGSAAATRVTPIAVRYRDDPLLVDAHARHSAMMTHAHPVGIDAAAVQAVAIAAALRGVDPVVAAIETARTDRVRTALEMLATRTSFFLEPDALWPPRQVAVPATGDACAAAAIVAGSRAGSFRDAVTVAIRAGGATGTVGAMAAAIAGARRGVQTIPGRWIAALEDGPNGRTHVEELAIRLTDQARGDTTPSETDPSHADRESWGDHARPGGRRARRASSLPTDAINP